MALMKHQRRSEPPKPVQPEPRPQPEPEPEPELQPKYESDIPEEYRSPLD